ncbi:MAG: aminoacyl-tRNA hydrolase [Spirochaetes bacterium]|nr:aminoacyl-tRNA hydrolase [Spirochaetota bacterium]
MHLIMGLGNPGKKYTNNRHNIGFMFLDYLVDKNNLNQFKKKKNYYYSLNNFNDINFVCIKPATYMNLSGNALISAMNFFKIEINDILIILDDIALPFGKIRIRENGSHGGHNGLKNIQLLLGNQIYKRIRIGIGSPEYAGQMINYVLGDFNIENINTLKESVFPNVEDSIKLITNNQIKEAMNKYNAINISENKDQS